MQILSIPYRIEPSEKRIGIKLWPKHTRNSRSGLWLCFTTLTSVLVVPWFGCMKKADHEVVVYTALDRGFSEPIFNQFTSHTGIVVLAKYDTESNKTVGLTNFIMAEANRPRCDLFWNNEILNTLRLDQKKLLDAYESTVGQNYPAEYRSATNTWYGFAARARILVVNTNLVKAADRPNSIWDMVDPRWKERVGVAKPLFGTTATHVACLFSVWGSEKSKKFLRQLRDNSRVLSGNRQVAEAVASGSLVFGLTDTDDALVAIESGKPVQIVYPDQDGMGTLFIPNTLALIRGSGNLQNARKLADFLLSRRIEDRLAMGPSAQIPLHPESKAKLRTETPRTVRAMSVDFSNAAQQWDKVATFLKHEFASVKQ